MFQCSTSSSLEIVDALTEAAEDTPDRILDKVRNNNHIKTTFHNCKKYFRFSLSTLKEGSPAESVLSCPDLVMVEPTTLDDFQDAMTTSQYAQVKLMVLLIK